MGVVVQKYGGSSVADPASIKFVAEQIVQRRREGDSLVVVVSAMGKTTDQLLALAHDVAARPSRRELDMLVTSGERISMALLSMAIEELGERAVSFTGSQSGIITEPTHQGARIVDVRPFRLREALDEGRIVIVAGYQGVSTEREVTTLGRGGSDTTAVALAGALDATSCEIYSDVAGVYTADPRVCAGARRLEAISYDSMRMMAKAGAKVLNAEAVAFAEKNAVTILACKTGNGLRESTRVSGDTEGVGSNRVLAVVGNPNILFAEGDRQKMLEAWNQWSAMGANPLVLEANREQGSTPQSRGVLPLVDCVDSEGLLLDLNEKGVTARRAGAVSLVGPGVEGNRGCYDEMIRLDPADAAPILSQPGCVTAVYPEDNVDEIVPALHRQWVEKDVA